MDYVEVVHSPLLFNCFINDLALKIKAVGKGISVDDNERICILLYADDIVLGVNETALQTMLNELSNGCEDTRMAINNSRSKVVHYRPESVPRSSFSLITVLQK